MSDEIHNTTEDGFDKAEQKRQRERQRRVDLSQAFEELSQLLEQIGPLSHDKGDETAARVTLIRRASSSIRRLHTENQELSHMLANLHHAQGSKNMFVSPQSALPSTNVMLDDRTTEQHTLAMHKGLAAALVKERAEAIEVLEHRNNVPQAQTFFLGQGVSDGSKSSISLSQTLTPVGVPLPNEMTTSANEPLKGFPRPVFMSDAPSIGSLLSSTHEFQRDPGSWTFIDRTRQEDVDALILARPEYEPFRIPSLDEMVPAAPHVDETPVDFEQRRANPTSQGHHLHPQESPLD